MNLLTIIIAGGTMVIFGGFFSRWQKAAPDLDQLVLDQLKQAGGDLSKPHSIEFFLYFENEDTANTAAKEIGALVDEVKVEKAAKGPRWLCFATRCMVPDHDELGRLRKNFTAVGDTFGGEYDGWGTEVVK
jgi:regulator of RNase E activity RraB